MALLIGCAATEGHGPYPLMHVALEALFRSAWVIGWVGLGRSLGVHRVVVPGSPCCKTAFSRDSPFLKSSGRTQTGPSPPHPFRAPCEDDGPLPFGGDNLGTLNLDPRSWKPPNPKLLKHLKPTALSPKSLSLQSPKATC